MSDLTSHEFEATGNPVTRIFHSIWNGLVVLAESSGRAQAVRKLNAMSDEELEARGTSRQEIVRKIFADCSYA